MDCCRAKSNEPFFENSTENQEKEDKPKEEEAKEPLVEEKPRTRSSQPKEAAPAFMSNVFALLDVYMNKMLVSPFDTSSSSFSNSVSLFVDGHERKISSY